MLNNLMNVFPDWLALVQAWLHWIASWVSVMADKSCSLFVALLTVIHAACGSYINHRVTWHTIFSYTEEDGDVSVIVRVGTSFGFSDRLQGKVILQRFGQHNVYRLLIDGHLPPSDGENGMEAMGERLVGAVYLPME